MRPGLTHTLSWARAGNHGIKVMIDLHGAPGSQNGFDNSGNKGVIKWTSGDTIDQTHKALNKIRDDHASNPAVASIELLNEPMGPELDRDTIRQFYYDGWGDLKNSDVAVTVHDAFEGVDGWNGDFAGLDLTLDTHHYEVFDSSALEMSAEDHVSTACQFGDQMSANSMSTLAGEWYDPMLSELRFR